jgi:hypothetical protein
MIATADLGLLLVPRQVVAREDHLDLVLFRNAFTVEGRHWIGVDLAAGVGVSPLGARVLMVTPSGSAVDAYVAGDIFGVQHPPTLHFGLGNEDAVREIRVAWPDGSVTLLEDPAVDMYHPAPPAD